MQFFWPIYKCLCKIKSQYINAMSMQFCTPPLSIRNGGGGKKWSPGRVPYIPFYPAVMFHQ